MSAKLGMIVVGFLSICACSSQQAAQTPPHAIVINGKTYPPLEDPLSSGVPTKIVRPECPAKAKENQVEGFVDLNFVVDDDGSVRAPEISREEPAGYGFGDEAMRVFVKWKFPVQKIDGQPVPRQATFRIIFRLGS